MHLYEVTCPIFIKSCYGCSGIGESNTDIVYAVQKVKFDRYVLGGNSR